MWRAARSGRAAIGHPQLTSRIRGPTHLRLLAKVNPGARVQQFVPLLGTRVLSSSANEGAVPADAAALSLGQRARHWAGIYSELSKVRLSGLVVMTTAAGYFMSANFGGFVPLAAVCVGTSLAACSANTFNQVWEIKNDLQMKRTALRPLPSGRISQPHALAWGFGTGAVATGILAAGANPLTAALGAGNIALYALVYTPLKVRSEWNTWAGSIVGAIPPVMGYTAATGLLCTPESALLASTLFLWQFPHFFALSWRLRQDYARGGFQMVAVNDPSGARTAELVWRYSLYMAPLPVLAAAGDITSWMFAAEGIALNSYLLYLANNFKAHPTPANSHKVFMCSLWYLPVFLGLMIFHKKSWAAQENENTDPNAEGSGVWRETMSYEGGKSSLPEMIEGAKSLGRSVCVHEALTDKDGFCPKVATDSAAKAAANTQVQVEVKTGAAAAGTGAGARA